jgi:hypothetical protein
MTRLNEMAMALGADASRVAVLLQESNQGSIVGSAVATLRSAPALAQKRWHLRMLLLETTSGAIHAG